MTLCLTDKYLKLCPLNVARIRHLNLGLFSWTALQLILSRRDADARSSTADRPKGATIELLFHPGRDAAAAKPVL
jgi:hypothetical protein